jgi:hypothetical protein
MRGVARLSFLLIFTRLGPGIRPRRGEHDFQGAWIPKGWIHTPFATLGDSG